MWAHGFRDSFNPLAGCFSPFPHGTCSLSVSRECLALPGGPGGFAQGYTCPALLREPPAAARGFAYWAVTIYGRTFQTAPLAPAAAAWRPYYPRHASPRDGFGLAPVRSPLLGGSLLFSLPAGTKMFQFPALASRRQSAGMAGLRPAGFSHSGTPGSKAACAYPGTFAACRALLRLREPRHPPCALGHFPSHPRTTQGARASRRAPTGHAPRHRGAAAKAGAGGSLFLLSTCVSHHVKDRNPTARGGKG